MRTLLAAVVGTLLGATAASPKRRRPSIATSCPSCRLTARPAIAKARWRRCRSSPTSRRGPGRSRSRRRRSREPCRPGSPSPASRATQTSTKRCCRQNALDTLARWADGGAPAGDPATAPPARVFPSGWNITPDVVVEMPKPFEMPARGTINYKYVLVKTDFKEDMWVVAAEMRPGNSQVLHHGKVWVRPPGSKWMENAVPGEAYETETQRAHPRTQRGRGRQRHPRQVQSRPRAAAVRPSGRGEVHSEGFRPRVRAALHDHGHAHVRCIQGRLRAGEEPARHALLLPRRARRRSISPFPPATARPKS